MAVIDLRFLVVYCEPSPSAMKASKHILTLFVVALILAGLVYLQFREWQRFDWKTFKQGTRNISIVGILAGVVFVHFADFLRAIRWKIFLRPSLPNVSWTKLIAPQFVGFAGLALLGRPGEFVRPYLLAKKTDTTVPSQLAIWFVERACDIGIVTLLLAVDIFFVLPAHLRDQWAMAGYILIALFVGFVVLLFALWRHGTGISAWLCRQISFVSKSFASSLEHKLRSASKGLHTMHDWRSFFQVVAISAAIWFLVAIAYRQVTHAFPLETGMHELDLPEVILLMGASVVGGVLQLPVVGGGSQLATIAVLSSSFGHIISPELAVAAGILFWLVTFMSVAPLGVVLARFEHLSIRRISREAEEAERQDSINNVG